MRLSLVLFSLLISFPVFSKTLSCSANGTDVYYINGVLTNYNKNKSDTNAIKDIINAKGAILDSGPLLKNGQPPVNYIGIHNPSFGAINDAAELFAQAYFIKTGSNDNAKAIYNVIKNTPEATLQDKTTYDPNGYFSSASLFVKSVNYATLINVAMEADQEAIKRSMASVDTLLNENNTISDVVRGHFILSKSAKRKILVVSHSQGNAVVNSAFRKISDSADNDEINYMSKFAGVFHVASPVSPIQPPFKSRNIRSNQDLMIEIAKRLGLPTADITHDVVSRSTPDFSGHLFYDTYMSPNVLVRPHLNTTATPISMSEKFVTTLSDLATDLEDNCDSPIIQITCSEAIDDLVLKDVMNVSGTAFFNRKIHLEAKDLNDKDGTTTFKWNFANYTYDQSVWPYIFTSLPDSFGNSADVPTLFSSPMTSAFTIVATNSNGKTAKVSKSLKVTQNNAPSIITAVGSCIGYYDSDGQMRAGGWMYAARFKIHDDSRYVEALSIEGCNLTGSGIADHTSFGSTTLEYILEGYFGGSCDTWAAPGESVKVKLTDEGGMSRIYSLKNPCTPDMILPPNQEVNISL